MGVNVRVSGINLISETKGVKRGGMEGEIRESRGRGKSRGEKRRREILRDPHAGQCPWVKGKREI